MFMLINIQAYWFFSWPCLVQWGAHQSHFLFPLQCFYILVFPFDSFLSFHLSVYIMYLFLHVVYFSLESNLQFQRLLFWVTWSCCNSLYLLLSWDFEVTLSCHLSSLKCATQFFHMFSCCKDRSNNFWALL